MTGIGVSTAFPGAAPAYDRLISIGVDAAGRPVAYQGTEAGGTGETVLDDAPLPLGRYWVTVSGSVHGLGLVMTSPGGTHEWRWSVPADELAGPVGNVAVWNGDQRGARGSTIRTLGYRQAATPLSPVPGLVSRAPIVLWGWGAGTEERISLPGDYDPAVPVPLVLFAHGSRQDENSVVRHPESDVYAALLDAGYAVAASSQHGSNWGNEDSVRDLRLLYRSIADRFELEGGVFLLAESMGGLSSLTFAADGQVPVVAWAGIYPVTDLRAAWLDNPVQHTAHRGRLRPRARRHRLRAADGGLGPDAAGPLGVRRGGDALLRELGGQHRPRGCEQPVPAPPRPGARLRGAAGAPHRRARGPQRVPAGRPRGVLRPEPVTRRRALHGGPSRTRDTGAVGPGTATATDVHETVWTPDWPLDIAGRSCAAPAGSRRPDDAVADDGALAHDDDAGRAGHRADRRRGRGRARRRPGVRGRGGRLRPCRTGWALPTGPRSFDPGDHPVVTELHRRARSACG